MTFESPTWQLGIDKRGKRLRNTHNLTELSKNNSMARPLNSKPQGLARVRVLFHPSIASWAELLSWNAFKTCRTNIVKAPYDMKTNGRLPVYILVAAEFPGMLLTHPFKAYAMKVRQEEILTALTKADRSFQPNFARSKRRAQAQPTNSGQGSSLKIPLVITLSCCRQTKLWNTMPYQPTPQTWKQTAPRLW